MRRLNRFAVPLIALGLILYWILQRGPSYLSSYFAALEIQALQDAARLYSGRFAEYIPRHLHPPLTSAVLGLWTQLGDSERILRLFPVACGLGTLVLYTSLFRDKYGLTAATMAGLFFVSSWGFVVCHVGVLNYGWPLLLTVGMIALYAKYLERRQNKLLLALAVLTTIGIFSNYTIVFPAVALWGALCLYDQIHHGRFKTTSALAALAAIVPGTLWMVWHKSQLPPDTAAYLEPLSLGGGDFFSVLQRGFSNLSLMSFPCEWSEVTQSPIFLIALIALLLFQGSRSRWILLPAALCTIVFLTASLLLYFPWSTSRHLFPLNALYSIAIADICIQMLLKVRAPERTLATVTVLLLIFAMAGSHLFFPDWEATSSKLRNPKDIKQWRASLLADGRVLVSDQATWDRLSWYIRRQNFSGFHFPLFSEQIQEALPFRVILAPVWNFQRKESCQAVNEVLKETETYGGWRITSLADMAEQYGSPQPCIDHGPTAYKWQVPSAFIVSHNLFYGH